VARYGRARRCPPLTAIAASRPRSTLTSVVRLGFQPRRSHSANYSAGLVCPRAALHRRHATTSFSTHDGPPLTFGTRWSVVGATRPTHGRPHQTHARPSRAIAERNRSARPGWGCGEDEATITVQCSPLAAPMTALIASDAEAVVVTG